MPCVTTCPWLNTSSGHSCCRAPSASVEICGTNYDSMYPDNGGHDQGMAQSCLTKKPHTPSPHMRNTGQTNSPNYGLRLPLLSHAVVVWRRKCACPPPLTHPRNVGQHVSRQMQRAAFVVKRCSKRSVCTSCGNILWRPPPPPSQPPCRDDSVCVCVLHVH